jgi:hypothetical protein
MRNGRGTSQQIREEIRRIDPAGFECCHDWSLRSWILSLVRLQESCHPHRWLSLFWSS